MKRVFLGGTRESKWRDELIPMLKIDYFNPNKIESGNTLTSRLEASSLFLDERNRSDFVLFVIAPETNSLIKDVAEAVHYSSRHPSKTIYYSIFTFENSEWVDCLIEDDGSKVFLSLKEVADYLNSFFVEIPYNPNVVECLIERDGPTTITLGKYAYEFEKNDAGHYVCLVMNNEHRKYLTKLPDFRIYMADKLPKPEFTNEELDFIREWKIRGADQFMAYANVKKNIDKFNNSRSRVRKIACDKWKALLPKVECPIRPPDPAAIENVEDWLTMTAVQFKQYVSDNPEAILSLAEEDFVKAQNKWNRLVFPKTGEPWPIGDHK